jgi:hypothetical protein
LGKGVVPIGFLRIDNENKVAGVGDGEGEDGGVQLRVKPKKKGQKKSGCGN